MAAASDTPCPRASAKGLVKSRCRPTSRAPRNSPSAAASSAQRGASTMALVALRRPRRASASTAWLTPASCA